MDAVRDQETPLVAVVRGRSGVVRGGSVEIEQFGLDPTELRWKTGVAVQQSCNVRYSQGALEWRFLAPPKAHCTSRSQQPGSRLVVLTELRYY